MADGPLVPPPRALRQCGQALAFVAGLRSGGGASRAVLRRALSGSLQPLFGNALWMEYQDLLSRPVWGDATTEDERRNVLAGVAYTTGVLFYATDSRWRYGHFVWHLFVLTGTVCHFFAVYGYVA